MTKTVTITITDDQGFTTSVNVQKYPSDTPWVEFVSQFNSALAGAGYCKQGNLFMVADTNGVIT